MNALLSLTDELEILAECYERFAHQSHEEAARYGLESGWGSICTVRANLYESVAKDLRRVLRVNGIA